MTPAERQAARQSADTNYAMGEYLLQALDALDERDRLLRELLAAEDTIRSRLKAGASASFLDSHFQDRDEAFAKIRAALGDHVET